MSKFMRSCGIAALVLIVLGAIMVYIGGTVKGKEVISEVVDKTTNGKVHVNLDGLENWGVFVKEDAFSDAFNVVSSLESNVNYDIEDEMIFDVNFDIFKGDVEKSFTGESISDLDVEVGGCNFLVQESTDDEFHVRAENAKKFQGYVKNGVLHVKATTNNVVNGSEICNIVLSIPAGSDFDKVLLEIGAGVMDLGDVTADKIEMEVGAGQITSGNLMADTLQVSAGVGEVLIQNMQVNKLDVEVGVGNVEAAGSVAEKLDAECAMGNISLEIHGAKESYDYDIECGMGNIDIGDESFSGVVNEKTIDNNSGRKMDVECGMGNITITFTK